MKANELMVNDWVSYEGAKCRVAGFLYGKCEVTYPRIGETIYDVSLKHILPIPLTPEILEKNAEHRTISGGYALTRVVAIRPISDEAFGVYGVMVGFAELPVRISYVHELQHALRFCKIEKEITL